MTIKLMKDEELPSTTEKVEMSRLNMNSSLESLELLKGWKNFIKESFFKICSEVIFPMNEKD